MKEVKELIVYYLTEHFVNGNKVGSFGHDFHKALRDVHLPPGIKDGLYISTRLLLNSNLRLHDELIRWLGQRELRCPTWANFISGSNEIWNLYNWLNICSKSSTN